MDEDIRNELEWRDHQIEWMHEMLHKFAVEISLLRKKHNEMWLRAIQAEHRLSLVKPDPKEVKR